MPQLVMMGGRLILGWLGVEAFKAVGQTASASADGLKTVQKTLPWVVAGGVVYLVMRGRK